MDKARSFGQLLLDLRLRSKLTQAQLALAANVSKNTISEFERGSPKIPRESTVGLLADALGLTGAERSSFTAAARPGALTGGPTAGRALPRDVLSFTGRADELRWLAEVAADTASAGRVGVCVLDGMAGVGKTSLAVHAGHEIASHFPDGQLFLDLYGHTDGLEPIEPVSALGSLLRFLGVPNQLVPEDVQERAALYRTRLAGTRTLIILDNAASPAQVTPLLPGTPGCLVIVTSRRNLYELDGTDSLHLDVPPEKDAIAMFRAAAGSVPAGTVPADSDAVAQITAMCGCLPLGVRIAAGRARRRTTVQIEDVVAQLRHELSGLVQVHGSTLGAVFALSYRHLPQAEQDMFRHLGLIPGPDFDIYAAASLTGTDPEVAARLLESLLDHNLLVQRHPGRYRFHDLVRAYARTLSSAPADESADAVDRLLDWYLYSAQAADGQFERRIPRGSVLAVASAPRAIRRLDTAELANAWFGAELPNLEAAVRDAARRGRAPRAIALCTAMAHYLRVHGPWGHALALHEAAATSARETGDRVGEAGALCSLGVIQRQTGTLASALETLTAAVDRAAGLTDRHGAAAALVELGIAQRLTGDQERAAGTLTRALELYDELSDRHGRAGALAELALVQRQRGTFTPAIDNLEQSLAGYRGLGNRYGQAGTLAYLGSVQWAAGTLAAAQESLTRALKLYRELDDAIGQAHNLMYLGGVHREAGAYAEATASLKKALALYTQAGDRRSEAGALAYLGSVQTATGELGQAEQSLSRALGLFQDAQDRGGEAEALKYYAELATAAGEPGLARARYTEVVELARKISSAKDLADGLAGLGVIDLAEGETDQGRSRLAEALEIYESAGAAADAARVQAILEGLTGSAG